MFMHVKRVVILHGWGSSVEKFEPLKQALEMRGWKVFLPELPGFGISDPKTAWNLSDYVVYIREKARRIIMHSKITSCEKCGYNKHIEVAHRIQVSSYSDNTLISTINERSNLMILCPNCHWEYDHL